MTRVHVFGDSCKRRMVAARVLMNELTRNIGAKAAVVAGRAVAALSKIVHATRAANSSLGTRIAK